MCSTHDHSSEAVHMGGAMIVWALLPAVCCHVEDEATIGERAPRVLTCWPSILKTLRHRAHDGGAAGRAAGHRLLARILRLVELQAPCRRRSLNGEAPLCGIILPSPLFKRYHEGGMAKLAVIEVHCHPVTPFQRCPEMADVAVVFDWSSVSPTDIR